MYLIRFRHALIFLVVSLFTAPPCPAMEKVAFRNKTNHTLKTDCRKTKGKHDAFFTYFCYDQEGNVEDFDPGKDWEPVVVSKVCFRNKIKENIRVGIQI